MPWTSEEHVPDKHIAWARDFWSALELFAPVGVYVNFLGSEGENRVRAAYGKAKYARLVALKDKYDPTNFFRMNQNITPSVNGGSGRQSGTPTPAAGGPIGVRTKQTAG